MDTIDEHTYYLDQERYETPLQSPVYHQFENMDLDNNNSTIFTAEKRTGSFKGSVDDKFKIRARVHKQLSYKKLSKKHEEAAQSWRRYKLISCETEDYKRFQQHLNARRMGMSGVDMKNMLKEELNDIQALRELNGDNLANVVDSIEVIQLNNEDKKLIEWNADEESDFIMDAGVMEPKKLWPVELDDRMLIWVISDDEDDSDEDNGDSEYEDAAEEL